MDRYIIYLVCFFTYFIEIRSHEKQLTISIEPRRQDCFFEKIEEKQTVEVDYQVIDGGHGDLDITFQTYDPNGRVLLADFKKSGNTHTITSQMTGDYKFCFDNTFSSFNTKTVFLEIIIDSDDEDDFGGSDDMEGLNTEEVYELKIQDIQDIVNRVRTGMNKIRQLQDVIKSIEARDRNIAEENYFKVTTFSLVQIIIMLIVGSVQVLMLRSLFDDNSRVHKIWKNLDSLR